MGEWAKSTVIECCPYCDAPLRQSGIAEWQGLRVDWATATASFNGREIDGLLPMSVRFLHILTAAQGGRVRSGQFDALLGEVTPNCRSVHIANLRRWLRANGLPFDVPRSSEGRGYRLECQPPE